MTTLQCKTITDYADQGALPMFFSLRDCIPFAFESVLIVIFILFFGGNYFISKKKTGRGKVLIALMAASFIILPLSMMLALAQLVQYVTVLFWGFLSIIIFILFLLSDKN